MSGNFAIKGGGVGRLMANAILNFHFDYPHTSLSTSLHLILRWDDLDTYTRDEDTSGGGFSSWEVGLGRVLGAVRRKDWVAFETHLKVPAENSSSLILKHVFFRSFGEMFLDQSHLAKLREGPTPGVTSTLPGALIGKIKSSCFSISFPSG